MNTTTIIAQMVSYEQVKSHLEVFQEKIKIPKEFIFHSVKKVNVDKRPAYLFRYQKDKNSNLMNEHFSFIVSEKNKQILGFTKMDKKYNNTQMISKSDTEKIAKIFLIGLEDFLLKDYKNLWIEQHDESINVNGQMMTISGMKYKCYRSSKDDYAWVIVGFDGTVITFERDIKWNGEEHKRISEKWLHDNWIKNNNL